MKNAAIKALLAVASVFGLGGCGERDAERAAAELARRQQRREMAELSQTVSPEQRLEAAQAYLSDDNPVAARRHIRPLLITQPEDAEVLLLSAKIEAAAGEREAAGETLEAIRPSQPEHHREALWLAANWLVEAGRYQAAQTKLEQLLELYGDSPRVHRKLAQILNHQGRRIEAAVHLRALARSGEIREKELFAMNTYSDPFIDDTVPKPDIGRELTPAALAEAKRRFADGELSSARRLVDRLRRRFPDSTPIAAFQGRVHERLQDDRQLRDWHSDLPVGIEREPGYWYAVGSWLQREGRHHEAVRCLAESVARDQTDRFAYLALARSLESLGKKDLARRASQRFQLLAEAAQIARKIGQEPGTFEELSRMADILDQLRRPWEAISWRTIAVKTRGRRESELSELRARRDSLSDQAASAETDTFVTCGLDLADWPLPSAETLGGETPFKTEPLETTLANAAPLVLEDVAAETRLSFQYDNGDDPSDDSELLHQMTGGGIGVIDIDLDGWSDLYFTQGGGNAFDPHGSKPNRLFRNLHGTRFTDVTESTRTGDQGYGQGVAVADINQDGFPDLVVANIGSNLLYINNGDGTFSSRPLPPAEGDGRWTTSIACGDLSGDHLPEIVEVNYIDDPSALKIACTSGSDDCNPSVFQSAVDRVWRVDAEAAVSAWRGCQQMADQPNYGFAAVIANFDRKAGNDLFIANDTGENHLWISQTGTDSDEHAPVSRSLLQNAPVYGCAHGLLGQRQGCMGVAHGDFDRNGLLDLHVTNFWNQPADLYMQQPSRYFVNENAKRGIYSESRATVGWGTQAVDLDRDGWLDLAVLNGHLTDRRHVDEPYKMRPQLFRGGANGFQLVDPPTTGDYWKTPALGRTMAVLDWNGDAKPDLVTNHLDVPVALLENHTQTANSVRLELVGTDSERDAIGAEVRIRAGEERWTGWVAGGDGFLCSNEPVLDFGVGAAETVDSVEVRWPSGAVQLLSDLAANRSYLIVEGEETVFPRK